MESENENEIENENESGIYIILPERSTRVTFADEEVISKGGGGHVIPFHTLFPVAAGGSF